MNWLRYRQVQIGLAIALGLAVVGMPLLAIAQQYTPPRRGIPGRREGAGTRAPGDRCLAGQKPLMGLTPVDNFGATTSKTPTLFWYVPATNATVGEFRLLDAAEQEIYSSTVAIPDVPGVVSVQLPATVTEQMQLQQDYRWQFSLRCDANEPSKNPFVEGIVQRVEPSSTLQDSLTIATTPSDVATVYAKAGIWQDAIATLAEQRCLKPNDVSVQTSWTNLLRSVQLDSFTDAPLTKTCNAIGRNP